MLPAATDLHDTQPLNCGVAQIGELRQMSREAGVQLAACQMTVDLFGFRPEDFVPGVDFAGAATFLSAAQQASVCLFV